MKIMLRVITFCVTGIVWLLSGVIPLDKGSLNAETWLDKKQFPEFTYALDRQNIEIGFEKDFPIQKLSYFSTVDKYALTCSATINRDTTLKFSIGSLTAECEKTNTGQTIGEFKYTPISVALLGSSGNPPFRPYWGINYSLYSYNSFRVQDNAFRSYEGSSTSSVGLIGGVKYIPNKNVSVNLALNCELASPFNFESQLGESYVVGATTNTYPSAKLDMSNISVSLNVALRF